MATGIFPLAGWFVVGWVKVCRAVAFALYALDLGAVRLAALGVVDCCVSALAVHPPSPVARLGCGKRLVYSCSMRMASGILSGTGFNGLHTTSLAGWWPFCSFGNKFVGGSWSGESRTIQSDRDRGLRPLCHLPVKAAFSLEWFMKR